MYTHNRVHTLLAECKGQEVTISVAADADELKALIFLSCEVTSLITTLTFSVSDHYFHTNFTIIKLDK